MSKPVETVNYKGHVIEIYQDTDAQSPSEWGNTDLFLIADHRDFSVNPPDEKGRFDMAEVIERYKKTHWIFPLEAYIHSGVVLSLSREGNFPDRQWDVSQLGFVFAEKKSWRLSKAARKAALALIAEWNTYLSGDVYGYVAGDDSCWGFYGMEYCIEEAKSIVDYQVEQERKAKIAKAKAFIKNRVPLLARTFAVV